MISNIIYYFSLIYMNIALQFDDILDFNSFCVVCWLFQNYPKPLLQDSAWFLCPLRSFPLLIRPYYSLLCLHF